jgi:hypothetical protein
VPSLSANLTMAKNACAYVDSKLTIGPANKPNAQPGAAACVGYTRSTMLSTTNFIPHLAERAVANGCGNCGEQAAVAYMYILRRGSRPLDYMYLLDTTGTPIHSFVIIGYAPDPLTSGFGSSAVICDPWDDSQGYPAWKIGSNMSPYISGYTISSYHRD